MSGRNSTLFLVATLFIALIAGPASAQDRATRIMKKLDADGDSRINLDEWPKKADVFKQKDADGDGYLTLDELRGGAKAGKAASMGKRKPIEGKISIRELDAVTKRAFFSNKGRREDEIARGLLESGLSPIYPDDPICPPIDHIFGEPWRGPVSNRRHTGADIPAELNRPIIAMADGVVAKRIDQKTGGFRGRQIILRHAPQDTGLPVWLYTLYSHFNRMPEQKLGQRVRMGEVLGPNGKSGVPGAQREPHIHLAIAYSESPKYAENRSFLVPYMGHHADPVALFRGKMPLDANATRELQGADRSVTIAYKTTDGEVVPPGAKIIWPFACRPKEAIQEEPTGILDL